MAIDNARLYDKANQEIKERKEAEARYRTLAENAPVGIFSTDANGRYTYVNEHWSAIVGLSFDAAIGSGWMQNLHPDDHDRVLVEWEEAVREKRTFKLKYRHQLAAEETVSILGQAVPNFDQNGNVQGYIGTLTDKLTLYHFINR